MLLKKSLACEKRGFARSRERKGGEQKEEKGILFGDKREKKEKPRGKSVPGPSWMKERKALGDGERRGGGQGLGVTILQNREEIEGKKT